MWHKRLQEFARGVGKPHEPLFAPLLFDVAAQIEAITPDEMALSGTRIRKNVGELRGVLGTSVVFASAPGAETFAGLSAFGSENHDSFITQPRFEASLDAVRQWGADSTEPVIAAAFFGPQRYLEYLSAQQELTGDIALWYDHVAANLVSLIRLFSEAGIHLLMLYDTLPPAGAGDALDGWKGALGTIGNIARFHRVAPLLLLDTPEVPAWPAQLIACPADGQAPVAAGRAHGRAWSADPAVWQRSLEGESAQRVVTTSDQVPAQTSIDQLISAVQTVL